MDNPLDPRNRLPPGKLVPGDKTCSPCNSLLTNPDSLAAILSKEAAPFRYCRRYDDLEKTSNAGCILCLVLIDRHIQLGPEHVPPSDIECGVSCHCLGNGLGRHLVFTVQSNYNVEDDGSGLRSLLFKGVRKNMSPWDVEFSVEALHDDPVSQYVPARPVELDVGSDRAFGVAREWVDECLNTHTSCPKLPSGGFPLPTMVIELFGNGQPPRLYTSDVGESGRYVALSYCWGGPQPASTTTKTLAVYAERIPVENQPRTIQDAIRVTRELGIRYLWVDSLCIIQDDDAHKAREIANMRSVYENAVFTLCASSAKKSSDGFLHRRKALTHPITSLGYRSRDYFVSFEMDYRCPDGRNGKVSLVGDQMSILHHDPIVDRAWTFQESLLSSRCLVYSTTQMVWRCRTAFKTTGGLLDWGNWMSNAPLLDLGEPGPIGRLKKPTDDPRMISMFTMGNDMYNLTGRTANRPRKGLDGQVLEPSPTADIYLKWMKIVSLYTSRQLTDPSDKFRAIAGIARKFAPLLDDQYCAGLWRSNTLDGLAWQRNLYGGRNATRTSSSSFDFSGPPEKKWRAPSWSWASMNGAISYPDQMALSTMDPIAQITDVFVENMNEDPFGDVFWGELWIEGWLRRVNIEPITEEDWPDRLKFKRDDLRFADVFIRDGERDGIRCGSAMLDESIDGVVPYQWECEHGLEEIYALSLYRSNCWAVDGRALRVHGILLVKWPIGNYNRIGWFDSFASDMEEIKPWFVRENYEAVQLV